ncbi:hypothetical protein NXS19_012398 [Fusarium pseudograminearum]|nr:hypothetical protein NXS19_012398 [Fusarium pseudograminearum]
MLAGGAPAGDGKQRDGDEKESTANARDLFPGTGVGPPPISLAAAPLESRACRIDLSPSTALVAYSHTQYHPLIGKPSSKSGSLFQMRSLFIFTSASAIHDYHFQIDFSRLCPSHDNVITEFHRPSLRIRKFPSFSLHLTTKPLSLSAVRVLH